MDGNEKTSAVKENREYLSVVVCRVLDIGMGLRGWVVMFLIDFFRLAKAKA